MTVLPVTLLRNWLLLIPISGMLFLSAAADPAPPPPPPVPEVKPMPVPDKAACASALKRIQGMFQSELRDSRPDQQKKLAKLLFKEARKEKPGSALAYMLLEEGHRLATKAQDPVLALRILDKRRELFEASVLQEKAKLLNSFKFRYRDPADANWLTGAYLLLARDAVLEDDMNLVNQSVWSARSMVRMARNPELSDRIDRIQKALPPLALAFRAYEQGQAKLKSDPADAAARLAVGLYIARYRKNWQQALTHFSQSGVEELQAAVQKENSPQTGPEQKAEIGNAWWDAAEKREDASEKELFQGRAVHWYKTCVDSLKGLPFVQAKRRIDGFKPAATDGLTELMNPPATLSAGDAAWLPDDRIPFKLSGKVWKVSKDGKGDATGIKELQRKAGGKLKSGDVIEITDDEQYFEDCIFHINEKTRDVNLVVRGAKGKRPVIWGANRSMTYSFLKNAVWMNLTFGVNQGNPHQTFHTRNPEEKNLFYNCLFTGTKLTLGKYSTFLNCVFATAEYRWPAEPGELTIRNCIFYKCGRHFQLPNGGNHKLNSNHNCFSEKGMLSIFQKAGGDTHSVEYDPMFVSGVYFDIRAKPSSDAKPDYHLKAGSPCLRRADDGGNIGLLLE